MATSVPAYEAPHLVKDTHREVCPHDGNRMQVTIQTQDPGAEDGFPRGVTVKVLPTRL